MIGKVVDGSALAAMAQADIEATSWIVMAYATSQPLYIPELAFAEVRALRPHAEQELRELREHPAVVVKQLTVDEAQAVEDLLGRAWAFDVLAAHAVLVAAQRGWLVVTSDPDRLRRLEPHVELNLL